MMEYLLISHPCRRQIAELPDQEIERLLGMLREAVNQAIAPQDVYDAIARGFERVSRAPVVSPPLAYNFNEVDKSEERAPALRAVA